MHVSRIRQYFATIFLTKTWHWSSNKSRGFSSYPIVIYKCLCLYISVVRFNFSWTNRFFSRYFRRIPKINLTVASSKGLYLPLVFKIHEKLLNNLKVPWHIRRYIYQVNKALVDVLFWTLFFHFQQSSGRKSFFELLKREVRERVKRGIKKDWKKEQPEERLREPFLRWVLLYLFYYK